MPFQNNLSWVDNDTAKIVLEGELDAASATLFKDTVEKAASGKPKRLVLHLEKLTFMASAGLRVLLGAVKAARRLGGDLRVAAAQPRVERVLALSGFTGILRCYPDVPSAVASWAS